MNYSRIVGPHTVLLVVFAIVGGVLVAISGESSVAAGDEDDGVWFPVRDFESRSAPTLNLDDGRLLVSLRDARTWDPLAGKVHHGSEHPEANMEFNTGWRLSERTLMSDGRVFAAGGTFAAGVSPGSTGSTTRVAAYDPVDESWTDLAELPERRSSHSLTLLDDGSILTAGGESAGGVGLGRAMNLYSETLRYVPDEATWEPAGELNEPRINHYAKHLQDGRVLIIGGRAAPDAMASSVEVYDPETNAWTVLVEELPDEMDVEEVIQMPDDRMLILGGVDEESNGTYAWMLDPESGEIDQLADMSTARDLFAAALLDDGSILVAGGREAAAEPVASAERYFPDSDEWHPVTSMDHPRTRHQLITLDSGSYGAAAIVIGGIDSTSQEARGELFFLDEPGVADRQPPPADDDPAHQYFAPTGHYLSYGFKDFWEDSGGLPVFGYPLTTEFDEFNPEVEEDRTSQYFERQRFEYHPEHAGTPYEVQLGRLGHAEAAESELMNTDEFAAVDPDPLEDNCHYFAETGHAACGSFLDYWSSHGLEFGDEGTSFRESLALFGYPISQEFEDPDTGLVTQYFERARFEFHPDNPEEYQVLLGRLGADLVEERDW